MGKKGTIADVTRWAEDCLPGEESRARSAIVTIRKAGLFSYGKSGPRGRHAAFMIVTDFATALCAVLHPGAATKADEAVRNMWKLPLSLITVDRASDGRIQLDPNDTYFAETRPALAPYLDLFDLTLWAHDGRNTDTLLSLLTHLFVEFAPRRNFGPYDTVELEAAGDKLAVNVRLHGAEHGSGIDGWPGEGVNAGAVHLTFGDIHVFDERSIKTTRTLRAPALNELSLMTPNITKGSDNA